MTYRFEMERKTPPPTRSSPYAIHSSDQQMAPEPNHTQQHRNQQYYSTIPLVYVMSILLNGYNHI